MIELSLHVLDLMENSVRAGARTIRLAVVEDPARDRLTIVVEDDGPGMPVEPERAADPFFTTKPGAKTGLGLSLFRAAAEQAGGGMTIGRSDLGGAAVAVELGLGHVDRVPLGDLPATVFSMLGTHAGLDVRCRLRAAGGERTIVTAAVAEELGDEDAEPLRLALAVCERVRRGMRDVGMTA
jgi:hypothetical protein